MPETPSNARALPATHRLLAHEGLADGVRLFGRARVKRAINEVLARAREGVREHGVPPNETALVQAVRDALAAAPAQPLRSVLNLSGTLLHTNLGRAQLPAGVAADVARAARSAVNLEFELDSGTRGHRDAEVAALLCELTGAAAATVVNNNAAALLLVLNTLAMGAPVPVARGELIEIGGSFRLPEIMARSGAVLREIGTTNRTHARDYAAAVADGAAMVLRVHPSNYEIRGFTHQESDAALAAIAHAHGVPYVVDLGSGALVDLSRFGAPPEPLPGAVLEAGADLVLFSGDKLLGGPQAGLIVGHADLVARIDANPLKRALRLDKLALTALAGVLKLYGDTDRLVEELPLLRQLRRPLDALRTSGERIRSALHDTAGDRVGIAVVDTEVQLGSGAQPTARIPSVAIALEPRAARGKSARLGTLLRALRRADPPVIGRIDAQRVLLDLRTLEDEATLTAVLRTVLVDEAPPT